ncbi:MAG: aminotransferase class IV [Salinirussus sp.]
MTGPACHLDGRVVPASEATVSVRDRGFRYGDGAVERLRVYGGDPFEWTAHASRFERSCAALGFDHVLPPTGDLRERVVETLEANGLTEALVELSATRGVQDGDHTPDPRIDPTILVTAREMPRGGVGGERAWDGPARLRTAETRRPPDEAVPGEARTHADLTGVLARREVRDEADEALLRDVRGVVCAGVDSNVFFVREGTLHTPTADLPLYPSIARGVVLEVADDESFPVEAGRYGVGEVRGAEEVFLVSADWEVRPVTRFDGRDLSVGPLTRLCGRLFDERVERAHYDAGHG